jgi:limonene-1,2-epoxide hydrolase
MPEEPTTPDLEERMRRMAEAASRRDVDVLLSYFAPNAVLDAEGVGTFEGVDAIRAFLEDWYSNYEEFEASADEIVHLDEGVFLTVSTQVARLRRGTEPLRFRSAHVWRFEAGMVVYWTAYTDIHQARAAAERLTQERG